MQNNSTIEQNILSKGMNTDVDKSLQNEDLVTYARNASLFSKEGDVLLYQTDTGNKKVTDIPMPCIGDIKLPDGNYVLLLTDNVNSEIGIFNILDKTYTTKLRATWLNFHQNNIITGVSKEDSDGSYNIYFSDGRRNPDRIINLNKIKTSTFDSIRLAKLITPPNLHIKQSVNGLLPNGAYQACLFYSANGQKFGQAYSLTIPIPVFDINDNNGALEVSISELDSDFKEFQLVVIQSSKGTTTAKIIGTYPSQTKIVHVSNFERPEYITLPLSEIVIENEVFVASDQMKSNNQHLFRIGVELVPDPNYQKLALSITSKYIVWQTGENYYKQGNNVGHYRNESYLYYIQLLHKTGKYSSAFVLKNRDVKASDRVNIGGRDIYELKLKTCDPIKPPEAWETSNTAGRMIAVPHEIKDTCEGWLIGSGEMGYKESTETYPDNVEQFGNYAGKPIQLFKFPNEEKVPRYSVINGKNYINILGIQFSDVPKPLKENGEVDEDWVGYRILRADREGNREIISRGLLANMRSYVEEGKETLYPNYPFNDLREDQFLSSTQTAFKNNQEVSLNTLKDYKQNTFTFYSPHNTIGKYTLGTELRLENEEIATVSTEFVEPNSHPKFKLLTQFGFWVAISSGIIEAYILASGIKNSDHTSEGKKTAIDPGYIHRSTNRINKALDAVTSGAFSSLKAALSGDAKAVATIATVMSFIVSMGATLALFTLEAMNFANESLNVIYNFLGYRQYSLKVQSKAFFNRKALVKEGSKRRYIKEFKYLGDGIQTFDNLQLNNFKREKTVVIRLNEDILNPSVTDNSRNTLTQTGGKRKYESTASMYYATVQRTIKNQYGRVESQPKFILCHNNYFTFEQSPLIFGGDCWITKYSQIKTFEYFTQTLNGANYPDGVEYDYKLYKNIAFPRFWVDSKKYDFSSLLNKKIISRTSFSRTSTAMHNLDMKENDGTKFRVDNGNFYLSNNSVMEFFVESDYNLFFREGKNFYSENNKDLTHLFKDDVEEEFKYDLSLSKQADQIYALQQPNFYDPKTFNSIYKYDKNRLAYSLPSYKEQLFDNWTYFLSNNTHSFPRSEFGNFTSLHRVDGERLMFLFDRSSPYLSLGKQQLEVSDLTVTIGDGGIFAQPPRELSYTEQHYGNCQSKFASITCQFGTFYPSERQGRLMKFGQGLEEITRNGMYYWSKEFFPIKLISDYPNFKHVDNHVKGVGYQLYFDNIRELIFLTKKDYSPVEELKDSIKYNEKLEQFEHLGNRVELTNKTYFEDCSFTLSYSPVYNAFVSFYDFFPDWTISTENVLFTFKGSSIWEHNKDMSSVCSYYGKTYPFEVEFIKNNQFKVESISSIEYYLESVKYQKDNYNNYHVKDNNFDELIVYNSEQCSGVNKLIKSVNPYLQLTYPKFNGHEMEILFSKVENKYRVNQFKDLTLDRSAPYHLMHTFKNGWLKIPNPKAINYRKSSKERKLFRHYDTKILLKKNSPDAHMTIKLNLTKGIISPR